MSSKKLLIAAAAVACAVLVWWRVGGGGSDDDEDVAARDQERGDSTGSEPGGEGTIAARLRETLRAARSAGTGGSDGDRGTGLVTGRVLDSDSGEGVGGVDVLFRQGNGEETATSDDGGEFRLELRQGRYGVRAIGDRLLSVGQPDIRVFATDEPLGITVSVRRLATLRGKVVDFSGVGVQGAAVKFVAATPAEVALTKSGLFIVEVVTTVGGQFELDVLPKESALLEAKRGFLRRRVAVSKVVPGEARDGIVIELQKGVLVTGVVVDPAGARRPGATVSLAEQTDRVSTQTVESDREGRFAFEPMEPGALVVEARAPGFAASAPTRRDLKGGQKAELTIALQPSEVLGGRVVNASGDGVAGARVRIGRGGSKFRPIDLTSADDGSFELEGADRGKHWVSATKPGYATATAEAIEPPKSDLELVLLPYGSIRGRVSDRAGRPVTDFVVEIVSVSPRGVSGSRAVGKSTRFREETGVYSLPDLDPGVYALAVSAATKSRVALSVTVEPDKVASGDTALE